ncbi:MAG: glycolate oxidase subunit GlcE [Proteobacteria bacterium]|nr:glycolate oxidase subunit GlcE [Pseudomonadota bacterium]MDE3207420.1 glycolate oxidase subunit GlcE [Pseudomonadota bacterium]
MTVWKGFSTIVDEFIDECAERVRQARITGEPLLVQGSGSKSFYGQACSGSLLETMGFQGVIDYEPSELILTARCGTPLFEIEALLASQGQFLAFEPPSFGASATLGGAVACGLSGPRRATAGSLRDYLLGVRMIDGQGQDLRFGGQVMKNVAGYDVSRLMAGAMGTLGLLVEMTLRVMPRPVHERTLSFDLSVTDAVQTMNRLMASSVPVSATCYVNHRLYLRLSGLPDELENQGSSLGGDLVCEGEQFWSSLREQTHAFFQERPLLWRLSVPSPVSLGALDEHCLIEWAGALRWLGGEYTAGQIRQAVAAVGGHATLFRGKLEGIPVFHPQPKAIHEIQRRLKREFDPDGIFNRFRMAPDF